MDELLQFFDRVSLHPGRVQLVPVPGEPNTYDMVWADKPINEGTPLNAATLNALLAKFSAYGRIAYGTYVGTGKEVTINMGFRPVFFVVTAPQGFQTTTTGSTKATYNGALVVGTGGGSSRLDSYNSSTASLYSNSNWATDTGLKIPSGTYALCASGITYYWFAIREGE